MNPFATTAPRPLQPETESLIKILAILNSTIEDGKIKVFAPDGVSVDWGSILGVIASQTDLTDYVQGQIAIALTSVVQTQGGIDCSGNPNYPAATANFLWYVTVAGKIGGASGQLVSIGDTVICITTNPGGIEAIAGQYFLILNTNIPGLTTLGVAFATMVNPPTTSVVITNPDGTTTLSSLAFNEQIGTTYTLSAADAGKTVRCTNASDITLMIPDNVTVPFPLLTTIEIAQGGAGKITIGGAGVTIECPAASKRTTAQYAGACLKKRGTNTWWLEGRLE